MKKRKQSRKRPARPKAEGPYVEIDLDDEIFLRRDFEDMLDNMASAHTGGPEYLGGINQVGNKVISTLELMAGAGNANALDAIIKLARTFGVSSPRQMNPWFAGCRRELRRLFRAARQPRRPYEDNRSIRRFDIS